MQHTFYKRTARLRCSLIIRVVFQSMTLRGYLSEACFEMTDISATPFCLLFTVKRSRPSHDRVGQMTGDSIKMVMVVWRGGGVISWPRVGMVGGGDGWWWWSCISWILCLKEFSSLRNTLVLQR